MIDPKKTYRTRDGREVRIYATDAGGRFPVHAAVKRDDEWFQDEWTGTGSYNGEREGHAIPHNLDLIEVRPRIQREVWVNVYPECHAITVGQWALTKQEADEGACIGRIACVKVVIDCEEGEGL